MRQARVLDYRRHLVDKPQRWQLQIDRFAFADIPSLGTLEIPFSSPFTVLCGPNGVGKSSALAALRMAFSPDPAIYESVAQKLAGGSAHVNLTVNKAPNELGVEFGGGSAKRVLGADRAITFVNTGTDVHELQRGFCAFESVEELLNGAGSIELGGAQLAMANYVLHRDYRRIILSEVEMGTVAPFFEVSFENDKYDSRTMGSGELAAFHLWWTIDRAEKNSIVLIEEPESFLSPATQETMGNYLVASAVEKGLCVVITSHSAPIIAPLPKTCIKFLYRGPKGLRLSDEPSPLSLSKIGIARSPRTIVFVEDNASRTFTKLLLERKDALLGATVSIEVRNGEGEITRALDAVGLLTGPIRLLGMFDGDMKGKVSEGNQNLSMFLPGDVPIEAVFRQLVRDAPKELAQSRGISEAKIEELLAAVQGANDHDWYEGICKGLGLTKEQLFANLFVIWMRNPDNEKEADVWYEQIVATLGYA